MYRTCSTPRLESSVGATDRPGVDRPSVQRSSVWSRLAPDLTNSSQTMATIWTLLGWFLVLGNAIVPAEAARGPPIVFIEGSDGRANFGWTIPQNVSELVIVVDDPHNREVMHLYRSNGTDVSSNYTERIHDLSFQDGNLRFSLSHVTRNDAGNYTCREGSETGPVIPNCGQSLHFFGVPNVTIHTNSTSSFEIREGHNLTLTCVVESAYPDVPSDGFSWSFSLSDSSPPQQLHVTGDTLTLGPMTRKDSGQYTCQARNNEGFEGLIPPGKASVNVTVSSDASDSLQQFLQIGLPIIIIIIVVAIVIGAVVALGVWKRRKQQNPRSGLLRGCPCRQSGQDGNSVEMDSLNSADGNP